MNNKTSTSKDLLALILTAFVCAGIFLVIDAFTRTKVSKEWAHFIYTCLGYFVLLIYMVYTFDAFKRFSKGKLILFQIIFYFLTTGSAFVVFRCGLLPLPAGLGVYILPIVMLSIVSVIVLDFFTKRFRLFKK